MKVDQDPAPKDVENPESSVEAAPQTEDPAVQMNRRGFLGMIGAVLGGATIGLYAFKKLTSQEDIADSSTSDKANPLVDKKEKDFLDKQAEQLKIAEEKRLAAERVEQLKAVSEEIKIFLGAIENEEELSGNALYDLYNKMLKDKKREADGQLQMDIFRKVLADYIPSKINFTEEEKAIFEDNRYFLSRCIGLAHMTCHGKNVAGGKVQINSKNSIAKRYKNFKENTEMGKAIASSEKLKQYIDPDLLFSLIRNETDFVNFYNRAEGVRGEFQFTSMQPPAEDTFVLPNDLEHLLSSLKDTKDSLEYGRYVTLLRKKRYNEMYANLDDVEDNDIRKQIAMGLGFIYGNHDAVSENFSDNENIKKNQSWLMAIAFYNSDIARINPNLDKGGDLNDTIAKGSTSAFIETLPFYNGSGAGKLYVPRFIVGFDLLKTVDGNEDTDDIKEEVLYRDIINGSIKPNFGLPFKG